VPRSAFPVDGNFGLHIGAAFVDKGYQVRDAFTVGMNYIEVPVLLRMTIPTGARISPHVSVGPTVAFNIGCEVDTFFEGIPGNVDCEEVNFESRAVDWGFIANAGLSVAALKKLSVTFDVAYYTGRSAVADNFDGVIEVFSGFDRPITNRSWSFVMGVALPI